VVVVVLVGFPLLYEVPSISNLIMRLKGDFIRGGRN